MVSKQALQDKEKVATGQRSDSGQSTDDEPLAQPALQDRLVHDERKESVLRSWTQWSPGTGRFQNNTKFISNPGYTHAESG